MRAIPEGGEQWYQDFHDLSTDRKIEFGMMKKPYIGPIPAASIDRRAARYGGDGKWFERCMRAMDAAYLNVVRNGGGHRVNTTRTFGPDLMRNAGK